MGAMTHPTTFSLPSQAKPPIQPTTPTPASGAQHTPCTLTSPASLTPRQHTKMEQQARPLPHPVRGPHSPLAPVPNSASASPSSSSSSSASLAPMPAAARVARCASPTASSGTTTSSGTTSTAAPVRRAKAALATALRTAAENRSRVRRAASDASWHSDIGGCGMGRASHSQGALIARDTNPCKLRTRPHSTLPTHTHTQTH